MAKVGLKTTMALLAKGYSKKEIDALAAVDDELEKEEEEKKKDPDPKPEEKKPEENKKEDPEPDYKKLYEDLLKDNQEKDEQIKEIQKDNINENVLPDLEEQYKEEHDSLMDAIRSFY